MIDLEHIIHELNRRTCASPAGVEVRGNRQAVTLNGGTLQKENWPWRVGMSAGMLGSDRH